MNLLNVGIFGQSRVWFSGSERWTTPVGGVNFYDYTTNSFMSCCDPVGGGGSIWPRAGYLMMNSYPLPFTQITFAVAAENGSTSEQWLPGGNLFQRFGIIQNGLAASQLQLNAIVWGQGEADATLAQVDGLYYDRIISIVGCLRAAGNNVPFFLCQTSEYRSGVDNENYPPQTRLDRWKWQRRIQAEQRALMLRSDLGIYPGIYLDQCRGNYDGCHQTGGGQFAAGLMAWEMFTAAHANGIIHGQTALL